MKTLKLVQNSDEWFDARRGKITGSKVSDVITKRGTGRKLGFYQLIADQIATDPDGEDVMERGHRLEQEAVERYEKQTGRKATEVGMWVSDEDERIAVSPDRAVGKTGAIEVKCLGSAYHLKAYIEGELPKDYADQVIQYFVVNPDLKWVDVVYYDPRISACEFFIQRTERKDVEETITKYKEYQLDLLKEVDEWVERLAF